LIVITKGDRGGAEDPRGATQIEQWADHTRVPLAERFGHRVTDEESAEKWRKMREATAAHRAALAEQDSSH
jgi:hypothetical protein